MIGIKTAIAAKVLARITGIGICPAHVSGARRLNYILVIPIKCGYTWLQHLEIPAILADPAVAQRIVLFVIYVINTNNVIRVMGIAVTVSVIILHSQASRALVRVGAFNKV